MDAVVALAPARGLNAAACAALGVSRASVHRHRARGRRPCATPRRRPKPKRALTADMLVHEVLSRQLRDRRAVARYAGLTGSPDESGARSGPSAHGLDPWGEKGLAKAGSARVRRGMIQLAWRFLMFQKDSALAQWYRARTADARGATRKTMIVALARKLLIALWQLVTTGEIPQGVVLRAAA
jgi:transposase